MLIMSKFRKIKANLKERFELAKAKFHMSTEDKEKDKLLKKTLRREEKARRELQRMQKRTFRAEKRNIVTNMRTARAIESDFILAFATMPETREWLSEKNIESEDFGVNGMVKIIIK